MTWAQTAVGISAGGGVVLLVGAATRVRLPGQLAAGWLAQSAVYVWFGGFGWATLALTFAATAGCVAVADRARERADQ